MDEEAIPDLKMGIYKGYSRINLGSKVADHIMKVGPYVAISGRWSEGFYLTPSAAKIDNMPSQRKVMDSPGTNGGRAFPLFVDFNSRTLGDLPFTRLSATPIQVEFQKDGRLWLRTDILNLKSLDIEPSAPAEPVAKPADTVVRVQRTPATKKHAVKRKPLPSLPPGWIDITALDDVPKTAKGLQAAVAALETALTDYNNNTLTPLEVDAKDGRIVFKPVGAQAA
jgi:hypothetical protein